MSRTPAERDMLRSLFLLLSLACASAFVPPVHLHSTSAAVKTIRCELSHVRTCLSLAIQRVCI